MIKKKLEIDTFLMSCRVLGKNIHKKILDCLISTMKKRKFKEIELIYIATEKNIILKDIINDFNIKKKINQKHKSVYRIELSEYKKKSNNNIKINSL